ncbi:uncharacterized protein N7458_000749 [Penicillium daleae]|uniref:Uncharacterized protein n=1 Tax=Penicillium daleae TaxID=63821 RepID=A0AAD6CGR6_9EURO|nr:uncharacterized protein N7458_000749 [Penicillium daleae]KAJ5465063.1 hypothetical protein N7458_000749 [Penicillium daleae]
MATTYDHVIFVARSSIDRNILNSQRRESEADLNVSLEYTKACYEQAYGPITGLWEFHTFAWPSFLELPETCATIRFFAQRTIDLEDTNTQMMVVLNGWDGLTSHVRSFTTLFRDHASHITIRVFADQPRSFYQVNVAQIFQLFDGILLINPYLEGLPHEQLDEGVMEVLNRMESQLEYSTALFYRYFRTFGALQLN